MGSDLTADHYQGILIPDERVTNAAITAIGAGNTDSAYTEASPRPGTPDPDQATFMAIEASGTQTSQGNLEVYTKRAGHPGPDKGGFLWRDVAAGDAVTGYKGFDEFNIATGWATVAFSEGDIPEPHIHTIRLKSGKLMVAGVPSAGITVIPRLYNPSTSTWSNATSITPGWTTTDTTGHALIELPTGRVVYYISTLARNQVDAWYSDDEGTTWAIYASKVLNTATAAATIQEVKAQYNAGEVLMLVQFDSGSTTQTLAQYASDDEGQSFTQVEDDYESASGQEVKNVSIAPLPGGGFLPAWNDETSSFGYFGVLLASAFDNASSGSVITIVEALLSAHNGGCVWADEDGTLYGLANENDATTRASISTDGGKTWTSYVGLPWFLNSAAIYVEKYSMMSTSGRAFLVSRSASAEASSGPSVFALEMGGYSDHTAPAVSSVADFNAVDQVAWQFTGGDDQLYFPIEDPDNLDWTGAGAGTGAMDSRHVWEITTVANQLNYTISNGSSTGKTLFLDFGVEIDDGDGDKTTDEVAVRIRNGDGGTFGYEVFIRLESDGFRVWDAVAAAYIDGGAISLDLTSFRRFRIIIGGDATGGEIILWTCTDAHAREWTEQVDASWTNDGAGRALLIEWGHQADANNVSRWDTFGFMDGSGPWSPDNLDNSFDGHTNPTDIHPKSFPTLPLGVFDGVKIRTASGPSRIAETWQIKSEHAYGLENIDPRISPSPRARWRSADDDTEVKIVWEREALFTDGWWDNECFGIALINANFRTAYLEAWTGAAWSTLITLDTGTGWAFTYDREGRIFRPGAGNRAGPYVWYNDLAGDTLLLQGDDGATLIERNTEGAIDRDATIKLPMIWGDPDTLDGTEAGAGAGRVHRRNYFALLFAQPTAYDFIRLRIPAQTTATGDFRLGAVMIGGVAVFGWQYDRGWRWRRTHNPNMETAIDGTRRARSLGPDRRAVEFAWAETAVDASEMYVTDPKPDYVTGISGGGGGPIASRRDTPRQVEGIIDRTQGPVVPVAMLGQITPQAEGVVYHCTDNTTWVYGRIVSDSQREVILGDEGDGEVQRLSTIVVEEEV